MHTYLAGGLYRLPGGGRAAGADDRRPYELHRGRERSDHGVRQHGRGHRAREAVVSPRLAPPTPRSRVHSASVVLTGACIAVRGIVCAWCRWFPEAGGGGSAANEPFEWAVIGTALALVSIYATGQVLRLARKRVRGPSSVAVASHPNKEVYSTTA